MLQVRRVGSGITTYAAHNQAIRWRVFHVSQTVREARGTERRLKGESSRVEELTPGEERMLAKFLRELAMKVPFIFAPFLTTFDPRPAHPPRSLSEAGSVFMEL